MVLTLLYETGARVSEIIDITLNDINFKNTPYIVLHGKVIKLDLFLFQKMFLIC